MKVQEHCCTTALVADDDEVHLRFLANCLTGMGIASFLAVDGEQAVQMLKKCEPQIAFIDLVMPRMSGFEVAKWLAVHKPYCRRIGVTASLPAIPEGSTLDFDAILAKPLTRKDIEKAVVKWSKRFSG
jgi:CheY-like chemotaxis protein